MMYFVIYKYENKFIKYTNEIFETEKVAKEFAKKSLSKKDEWRVVEYNKDNFDKYWYI